MNSDTPSVMPLPADDDGHLGIALAILVQALSRKLDLAQFIANHDVVLALPFHLETSMVHKKVAHLGHTVPVH